MLRGRARKSILVRRKQPRPQGFQADHAREMTVAAMVPGVLVACELQPVFGPRGARFGDGKEQTGLVQRRGYGEGA
jgi:hypothetical protein